MLFKYNNIFIYQDIFYLVFNRREELFFLKMNNESKFLAFCLIEVWEKVQRYICFVIYLLNALLKFRVLVLIILIGQNMLIHVTVQEIDDE